MNTTDTNYKRFIILYVDDEQNSLDSLTMALEDTFTVLTATNAADGYRILEENQDAIGVLMTDQRMPGESGTQLLEKARALKPGIVRILATAYSDISAAIDAVNSGAIYRYVSKPWDVRDLEITLKRALDFFTLQRERDELLREKLSVTYSMVIADRIMMLGLIGAGLNEKFHRAPVAVRSYLRFAGAGMRRDSVSIEQLSEVSIWERFQRKAVEDANDLAGVLNGLAGDRAGNIQEQNIVALALAVAEGAGLSVDVIGDGSLSIEAAGSGQITEHFSLIWEVIGKLSPSECSISTGEGDTFLISAKIERAELNALRFLFNPFASESRDEPSGIGAKLLGAFIVAYDLGIDMSGAVEEGSVNSRLTLTMLRYKSAEVDVSPLRSALINETLWEEILDGF